MNYGDEPNNDKNSIEYEKCPKSEAALACNQVQILDAFTRISSMAKCKLFSVFFISCLSINYVFNPKIFKQIDVFELKL